MIRLWLKASQNLISLVENTGTGENLPVGNKVKFEHWPVYMAEPETRTTGSRTSSPTELLMEKPQNVLMSTLVSPKALSSAGWYFNATSTDC